MQRGSFARRREIAIPAWLAAALVGAGLGASCSGPRLEGETAGRPNDRGAAADAWEAMLLEVAGNYAAWEWVSHQGLWAPTLCSAPRGLISRAPGGAMSASGDEATHGGKLYFLFARDDEAYTALSRWAGEGQVGEPPRTPVGQTIVKETWTAVGAGEPRAADVNDDRPELASPVQRDGRAYWPGQRRELFIMHRMEAAAPGTDEGWVYGTVSADGKRVTSVGRIVSCMGCHAQAAHDRQFGVWGVAGEMK